jgi:hypothetical protein
MATAATTTKGATFAIEDTGDPDTYLEIAEVKGFSGIGAGAAPEIDATSFDSTAAEYLQGLADEGVASLRMNYTSGANQDLCWAARASGDVQSFQLSIPFGTPQLWTFDAFVQTFEVTGEVNGIVEANMGVRITGPITVA